MKRGTVKRLGQHMVAKLIGRPDLSPIPMVPPLEKGAGPDTPWQPPQHLFSPANPLNLAIDPKLSKTPTLNVLVPGMAMGSMSGGPNTILNLTYRMAEQGIPVRYLSTDIPADKDHGPLWEHICKLSDVPKKLKHSEIVDASDRSRPTMIGENDVFFVSAWWNAQMVKYALPLTKAKKFIYIIQDFEPGLHEWSTRYALALETYGLDYVPIINHPFLAEFLRREKVGAFKDPEFAANAKVVDAAIDSTRFYVEDRPRTEKRRLLFYARPHNAKRNLYEIGVVALQLAARLGAFDDHDWEILAMGEPIEPVPLSDDLQLVHTPWRDFDGYAEQMRHSDVCLSLMVSPHPSYPPLEMAACGGLVVTNTYANKTVERFAGISENILAVEPTVENIAQAIVEASRRSDDYESRRAHAAHGAPSTWKEAFADILPYAVKGFETCRESR